MNEFKYTREQWIQIHKDINKAVLALGERFERLNQQLKDATKGLAKFGKHKPLNISNGFDERHNQLIRKKYR